MEEFEQHRGLGLVFDHKLAAGRGFAFSAGAIEADADNVGPLDDGMPSLHYPGGEEDAPQAASTSVPLTATNKGYQLLQRMGWRGAGLGRNEDGIVEPVSAGVDAGVRLGLGKQAQDDAFTAAEGISRKKLEVEIQADEDPERRQRREAQAQREQQIKAEVTQILKTFFCAVCSKQYQTAMELEEHLSSYDHHHKKRLAEARQAEMERTRGERQKKEQKRQQREQQRLEEQIRRAQAAASGSGQQQQAAAAGHMPAPPQPPAPAQAGDGGRGGWGWLAAPCGQPPGAPPPPPPPPLPPAAGAGLSSSAAAAAAAQQAAPPPPPPPPPPDPRTGGQAAPQLAAGSAVVKFGVARPVVGGLAFGRGAGRCAAAAAGFGARRAPAPVRPAAGVFGDSSDEEEGGS